MSAPPRFFDRRNGLIDLFAGGGGASTGIERFADGYDLRAATTKSAKVRLVGNSVCPEVAEAVVRANVTGAAREAA